MERAECLDCEDGHGLRDGRCYTCSGANIIVDGVEVNTMDILEDIIDPRDPLYKWKGCIDCELDDMAPFEVKDCIECVGGETLIPNPDYVADGSEGPPNLCVPTTPPVIPNCTVTDVRGAYCFDCDDFFYISPVILQVWVRMIPLSFLTEQCVPCGTNCIECSKDQCVFCEDGYSTTDANGKDCEPRCDDDPECLDCIAPGVCEGCDEGSFPDESGVCIECPEDGCKICEQDDGECNECEDDYSLLVDKTCDPDCEVIENCIDCENPDVCTVCDDGYFLNDLGFCSLCSQLCLECEDNKDNCPICKDEFNGDEVFMLGTNNCETTCSVAIDFCLECS